MAAGDMLLKRALFYGCPAHLKNQTETVVGSHAATGSALPGNSLALLGDGERERGEERGEGRGGERGGGREGKGEREGGREKEPGRQNDTGHCLEWKDYTAQVKRAR